VNEGGLKPNSVTSFIEFIKGEGRDLHETPQEDFSFSLPPRDNCPGKQNVSNKCLVKLFPVTISFTNIYLTEYKIFIIH
jgi:hypothetical protein